MSHVSSDFEKFGGSYLLSDANYYRYVSGYDEIGRSDGQFMIPSNQMDELLANHPNDPREWERQLGLNNNSLGDEIIRRVDVYRPQDYEPRLPTSDLSGSNDKFLEGAGKVPGGQDECVINQFPNPENNPNVGKISEALTEQSKTNNSNLSQAKSGFESDKVSDGGGSQAPPSNNTTQVKGELPKQNSNSQTLQEPSNNPKGELPQQNKAPDTNQGDKAQLGGEQGGKYGTTPDQASQSTMPTNEHMQTAANGMAEQQGAVAQASQSAGMGI